MANQKLKIINCSNLQIKALSQAYKLEGGDKSSSPAAAETKDAPPTAKTT